MHFVKKSCKRVGVNVCPENVKPAVFPDFVKRRGIDVSESAEMQLQNDSLFKAFFNQPFDILRVGKIVKSVVCDFAAFGNKIIQSLFKLHLVDAF